ncbi:zinc ribbon domain-containing protein, partial [Aequoribacter sp.]
MSDRPFCRRCGTPLTERVPKGDHKPRWCCEAC